MTREQARSAIIIEDDANLNVIFSEAVRRAGYDVIAVTSGEQALEKLFPLVPGERLVPDLVVLDFHLPGISGVDVLNRIRSEPSLQEARIILATADPVLGELYRSQAHFLLVKPVSYHQLRDLAKQLAK